MKTSKWMVATAAVAVALACDSDPEAMDGGGVDAGRRDAASVRDSGTDAREPDPDAGPPPIAITAEPSDVAVGSPLTIRGTGIGPASTVTVGGAAQTFTTGADELRIAALATDTPLGRQAIEIALSSAVVQPLEVRVLAPLAVLSAFASSETEATVVFNRALDPDRVSASEFAIVPELPILAAAVDGDRVTLTTSAQTPRTAYTVTVGTIADPFGNLLTGDADATFDGFAPLPTITEVTPAEAVRGVSTLTITGTHLSGATVTVGGTAQTVASNSDTSVALRALATSTPVGRQPVRVSTLDAASNTYDVDVFERLQLLRAEGTSTTRVVVSFNRAPNPSSVSATDFTIAGIAVRSATLVGASVTLETAPQTDGTSYTVTAAGIVDPQGATLDPAFASATFRATATNRLEVVVLRVGDGVTGPSARAVPGYLDRYRVADGVLLGTVPIPTVSNGANRRVMFGGLLPGGNPNEGMLTRSADGRYLAMAGYDVDPASAQGMVAPHTTSAAQVPRVAAIASVDSAGTYRFDSRTTFGTTFDTGWVTSATTDGIGVWVGGSNDYVQYTALGPPPGGDPAMQPVTEIYTGAPQSVRAIHVFGGQLYIASGFGANGVSAVGLGTPTTPTTATLLFRTSGQYQFALLDRNPAVDGVDTAYYCELGTGLWRRNATNGAGGPEWTETPTAVSSTPCSGLTAFVDGPDVLLAFTSTTGLHRVLDVGGTSSGLAAELVAAAPAMTQFRGVALAPIPM